MKKARMVADAAETTPEALRRYRQRKRLTQRELAYRVGLNVGIIRDAEREPRQRSRDLTLRSLKKIEAATGLPIEGWL